MDNLLAERKAVPMLIVIPDNQVVHRNNPRHTELTFTLFEAELRQHVIPLVERDYPARRDSKGRAISGLSKGGRHTMFVGCNSLDLFASFGVLSAGDVDAEKSLATYLNDPDANQKIDYLFVGQGTLEADGRMGDRCLALHRALEKHSIKNEYSGWRNTGVLQNDDGTHWAVSSTTHWRLVRGPEPRFRAPPRAHTVRTRHRHRTAAVSPDQPQQPPHVRAQ